MSFDLFRWIVEHQSTALVLLDEQLCIRTLNSSAESLFARSANQVIGLPWPHLFTPANGLSGLLVKSVKEAAPTTQRSERLTLTDGSQITADVTLTPLLEDGSNSVLLEFLAMDRILRISREEATISKQEASRLLVRGLAHEVKNPLGGIRGAAQLLALELNDARFNEYTQVIIQEADRLRNLVDRILGSNRLPVWSEVNIHEVLEHILRLIVAESGQHIQLKRDYDPSLPQISADREQLIQALLNIVRNGMEILLAQEESNPNKQLSIATRVLRQFTIGKLTHRLVIQIVIEDNGPGVDPALADSLFYPMVSGRAQGSGLGLSIAQQVISQHGGLVDCDSEPGRTRFSVYLPIGAARD